VNFEKHCLYTFAVPAALPFARLAAQARSSAFLQAALIFRFFLGFSAGLAEGAVPLILAHLASWAARILALPAALTFRLFLGASVVWAGVDTSLPSS